MTNESPQRTWTIYVLIGITIGLIVWDVYVFMTAGSPATISRVVFRWAEAHPVIPFGIGVLCGHLLWPQRLRSKVVTEPVKRLFGWGDER